MIIVTGGAGFIGSNIVKGLNERNITDILVVDDLTDGNKFRNLMDCQILDYLDKDVFRSYIENNKAFAYKINAIFHEGACTDTTEWNGQFMLDNNYEFSKLLLHYSLQHHIPFFYASSAAVYGDHKIFTEDPQHEKALNVYGYSKLLFDNYVRRFLSSDAGQIVGFRYFNVYGPREQHKKHMASVIYQFQQQFLTEGVIKLFQGSHGYAAGEQRRDFIHIDDVVKINLWFLDHPKVSGIYNIGIGKSSSFNEVAQMILDFHQSGKIEYIPFPGHLLNHYQCHTQADINSLRQTGYDFSFKSLPEGIREYLRMLNANSF